MIRPIVVDNLLIVPYGIETADGVRLHQASGLLLIVPYGIETDLKTKPQDIPKLLIVPYGIETRSYSPSIPHAATFNRTLWN